MQRSSFTLEANAQNRNLVLAMEGTLESRNKENIFKRTSCEDWSEYFMGMALLSSKLSRHPYVKVGACIVNSKNEIVSLGYNGGLRECNADKFWPYKGPNTYLHLQPLYVPHAEINALYNRNSSDLRDCTIYVTLFPCNNCAKEIIASGIRTVVYLHINAHNCKTIEAQMMFDAKGVTYRVINTKIEIYFSNVDCGRSLQDSVKHKDQ